LKPGGSGCGFKAMAGVPSAIAKAQIAGAKIHLMRDMVRSPLLKMPGAGKTPLQIGCRAGRERSRPYRNLTRDGPGPVFDARARVRAPVLGLHQLAMTAGQKL
jgi:hypothetical protein